MNSSALVRKMTLTFSILMVSTIVPLAGPMAQAADVDPNVCGFTTGILGGIVGNQFGKGNGKDVATVIGAIIGAKIGHDYCKRAENADDRRHARQNERRLLEMESAEPYGWTNPRFGREVNSESVVVQRGWHNQRECTHTRSVMQDRGGRFVNETYWCQERGVWTEVTETTVSEIQWGPRGSVERTTTTRTTTRTDGRGPVVIREPQHPQHQSVGRWIISDNRLNSFERDISRDLRRDRVQTAYDFAAQLQSDGKFMTLDQLGRVLRTLHDDVERNTLLRYLAPVTDQRFGEDQNVYGTFQNAHGRAQASRILGPLDQRRQYR